MREKEIEEESNYNPDWDIDWDLFHTMCSDFLEHKHILFKDEVRQPIGWRCRFQSMVSTTYSVHRGA